MTNRPIPLPPPTGSHAVGVRDCGTFDLYYPAAEARPPRDYVPGLDRWRAALREVVGPRRLEQYVARFGCVVTAAGENAAPAEARRAACLLCGGGNLSRHFYTALAQDLASHGLRVAVASHPGSGMDLVGGRLRFGDPVDKAHPICDAALSDLLAAQASAVLDRLDGPVVLIGHSRGGRVCGRLAGSDPRVTAAVWLDSDAGGPPTVPHRVPHRVLHAPGRTVRGDMHATCIAGAGHFTFCDLPLIAPEIFPAATDPVEGHRRVAEEVRQFLRDVT